MKEELTARLIQKLRKSSWPKTFVEVGAGDGLNYSIGRILLKNNWGGLLLEPHFITYRQLVHNLAEFPKARCENLAISNKEKHCWMSGQNCSYLTPKASFHPQDPSYIPDIVLARAMPLASVTGNCTALIIDTEGHDLEVLKGIGKLRPNMIVTEVYSYLPKRYLKKQSLLFKLGYVFLTRIGWDDVWIDPKRVSVKPEDFLISKGRTKK
jgi:FkbM family methyltransferase